MWQICPTRFFVTAAFTHPFLRLLVVHAPGPGSHHCKLRWRKRNNRQLVRCSFRCRKQLYLAIHPETAVGATKGKGRGKGKEERQNVVLPFTEDTSSKTGQSRRTVERSVALAEAIPEDVQEKIADSPVADNQTLRFALAPVRAFRGPGRCPAHPAAERPRRHDVVAVVPVLVVVVRASCPAVRSDRRPGIPREKLVSLTPKAGQKGPFSGRLPRVGGMQEKA